MTKERLIETSAVNIRVHPEHNQTIYRRALGRAFELRRAVRVRGDQHLLLSEFSSPQELTKSDLLQGVIARFTELDPNLPWFNAKKLSVADERELQRVEIPQELKPNYVPFYFAFDPKKHILVFETLSEGHRLSPKTVVKYFDILLNTKELLDMYEFSVTDMISDENSLTQMMQLSNIRKYKLVIRRPNPDDGAGMDEEVERRLREQHGKKMTQEFVAAPKQSFRPDKITRQLSKIALQNGHVEVSGKDADGLPAVLSTRDHPKKHIIRYDSGALSPRQAFLRAARQMFDEL